MKLETITVKGVLAFRESVTLDLRDVPAGLVAVVGPNGGGKTTLMEATPGAIWREFPSRADKSLVDYAHDRDSVLEVSFEIAGRGVYRPRVSLDGVSRASDAVMCLTAPDGSLQTLTDGKVSSFDAWVQANLPARELVLASSFAAQNRHGSFVRLDRKGRKELFATLLGLDRYESMAAAARTAVGFCEASRGRLVAVRDVLARDTSPALREQLATRQQQLSRDRADLAAMRVDLEVRGEALETERQAAADALREAEASGERRRALEADVSRAVVTVAEAVDARGRLDVALATDLQRTRAQHDARLSAHIDRAQVLERALPAECAALDEALAATVARLQAERDEQVASIDTRLANNRTVLAEAAAIRAAVETGARLEAEAVTVRAEIDRARAADKALEARWRDARDRVRRVTEVVQPALSSARSRARYRETVPCHGHGAYAGCPALADAGAAADQIPALEREVQALPALRADQDALEGQIREAVAAVEQGTARLQAIEANLRASQAAAARAPHLTTAEQRIADLTAQRADLVATTDRRIADERARAAQLQQQAQQRAIAAAATWEAERVALVAQHAETVAALERRAADQRGDLETRLAGAQAAHQAAQAALEACIVDPAALDTSRQRLVDVTARQQAWRAAWDANTARGAAVDRDLDACRRETAAFDQRQARLVRVVAAVTRLEADLLDWQLLVRILARDGLPTLEIANAGPEVSALASELLQASFGGRFSLDLVTEQAKRDGKGMKEVFELRILDNERGGSARDLSDLSGGEQIIVDEALKAALAIYVNQRAPMPIRTLWRDETTGPLDPANGDRYLQMLRRLRQLAGAHHLLFVTHSADVAAQADAQIQVGGGTARIVLPPFASTADAEEAA